MGSYYRKTYLEQNVYEKALERIEYLYNTYDELVISFSGGKDSTAMLLCTIDVARKLGKLPVKAVFYDEEAIHPTTIEYVERVRQMPEVDLDWYCLPIVHRNACSNEQPFWTCWGAEEKDIWVRDMPEWAITTHPRFKEGMSMQEFSKAQFKNTNCIVLQGIRTEESLRRYRAVSRKKQENYLTKPEAGVYFAYPIYDWSSQDVWKLVQVKNADYNRTYDIFNRTERYEHFLAQRVCPPFGEEPLRGLWIYKECFPELWFKMINRVKGASTAARYSNTELYSNGYKPEQTSWREHIDNVLGTYEGEGRATVTKNINAIIRAHQSKTDDVIPDDQPHPLTGLCWKFLSKMVTRGDFKNRVSQMLIDEAGKAQRSIGITQEQAEKIYGKKGKKL